MRLRFVPQHHVLANHARLPIHGRGQSLVEFALTIPIFIALLFGSIDMGMLFKMRSAYQEAAQQAVRVGAAAGDVANADQLMLDQLRSTVPGENLKNVTVTIYKANDPAYMPPLADAALGPYDNIHTNYIYKNGAFVCAATPTQPLPCDGAKQSYWDPVNAPRNVTEGSLDRIAIRISYSYTSVTGAFRIPSMTEIASVLMEPTSYALTP